jgi:hypothetical protein
MPQSQSRTCSRSSGTNDECLSHLDRSFVRFIYPATKQHACNNETKGLPAGGFSPIPSGG